MEQQGRLKGELPQPTQEQRDDYERNGYLILDKIISQNLAIRLRDKVDGLFRGDFETGIFPDEWTWRPNIGAPNATREIVNVWKCDKLYASVVLSPELGHFIAKLAGWKGARIAQDDLWWKPPGGTKEVSFHQDATYMKAIEPNDVITLWIALDDTRADAGTLEYVRGSHKWPLDQSHIPKDFFSPTDYKERLESFTKSITGLPSSDSVVPVLVNAGGGSLHHGRLLHGSGPNNTADWTRRSLAIHYIPSDSTFSQQFPANYIYGRYKKFGSKNMDEDFFPVTWSIEGHRSAFIREYVVHQMEIIL